MQVFVLVKTDFRHKTNIGVFDTHAKALAMQTSLEMELFDSGDLCGIGFYVEEHFVK